MLHTTFQTLGIPFDTRKVDDIIKEKRQVACSVLYNLKMALEKVNNPADVVIYSTTGKYNTITPLKKIKPPKEIYDQMDSKFFQERLNQLNKPQKTVNLEKHLSKFQNFKNNQDDMIKISKQKEELKARNLKDEIRKIQLNKLQRNMAFLEDWNQKGQEFWKQNQEIKKNREKSDLQFSYQQEEQKTNKLRQMHELTKKELVDGIDAFENNLAKYGLLQPQHDDIESGDRPNSILTSNQKSTEK